MLIPLIRSSWKGFVGSPVLHVTLQWLPIPRERAIVIGHTIWLLFFAWFLISAWVSNRFTNVLTFFWGHCAYALMVMQGSLHRPRQHQAGTGKHKLLGYYALVLGSCMWSRWSENVYGTMDILLATAYPILLAKDTSRTLVSAALQQTTSISPSSQQGRHSHLRRGWEEEEGAAEAVS